MIAVDTNVLVHAHREDATHHARASGVLKELAEGTRPWAIPWPCVYEFLRVVTHPRGYRPPSETGAAWAAIKDFLASPSVRLLTQTDRHAEVLGAVLSRTRVTGNFVHDAHIAALLEEHGVDEILTADEGFRRFPSLKVTNPFRS